MPFNALAQSSAPLTTHYWAVGFANGEFVTQYNLDTGELNTYGNKSAYAYVQTRHDQVVQVGWLPFSSKLAMLCQLKGHSAYSPANKTIHWLVIPAGAKPINNKFLWFEREQEQNRPTRKGFSVILYDKINYYFANYVLDEKQIVLQIDRYGNEVN